jgi:hypothetical protein
MERFIIQESDTPGYHVCTDTLNGIVCRFRHQRFADDQKVTILGDNFDGPTVELDLARAMREMGDWLLTNHAGKLFVE